MSSRPPNSSRSPGNDGNFERNKYRQTMPSRFNPISPPTDQRNSQRFQGTNSPTQSFVSTATNYEQPWNSPKFKAPGTPGEPRFRRTHSMAAKKAFKETKEDEKSDRPKINFMEIGKKITSKFKKNNAKNSEQKKADRRSVPIIKLGEGTSTSQPDLPTNSSPPKKNVTVKVTSNMKMQPEDRMKMFQKMGREQSMKVTSLQRMQRERQRDFTLVPGPGRAHIEANRGSNQSIDSMLVFNTTNDSRRSTSLSLVDEDVETVFKNSLTNKPVTSAQFNNQQKLASGPSFTSTPRLAGPSALQGSPTISNVRSSSEASYCMMTSHDAQSTTMYFSADTLNSSNAPPMFKIPDRNTPLAPVRSMPDVSLASSSSSTPIAPSPAATTSSEPVVPLKRVKEEVVDTDNRSSTCPSFTATPPPTTDLMPHQMPPPPPQNSQPGHLNSLWMVSKEIRENQLQLERSIPLMDAMRNRAMAIDQQKMLLLGEKGDNPSVEDMRQLWNLDREFIQVSNDMNMTSMTMQNASNLLPYLEHRRNELLSVSPPPSASHGSANAPPQNFPGGSFV